ncbi:unnamed protein product [Bursaphelenchus xylophilus]|uniref:(pine wood nematode) hypothetical protein n=1 Tax=Bursaphelenchus xylophilus TaxID=6326 RepID=A0A1I7SWC5_BURXY|nr:unnamed protein product [Bursaphelenchus xylophilus]CAG9099191.1 unnamed protein product [Bursaphelenchus xylophilus]
MLGRPRYRSGRVIWLGAVFLLCQSIDALFEEPRPLTVWEDPVPAPDSPKPLTWSDKSFGQWCRNFTSEEHFQCPQGSPFHWYYCCGPSMTQCCAAPQTWTIVVFGSLFIMTAFLVVLSILAHLDLIWSNEKPQKISILNYNPVKSSAII